MVQTELSAKVYVSVAFTEFSGTLSR